MITFPLTGRMRKPAPAGSCFVLGLLLSCLLTAHAFAQSSAKKYADGHGGFVEFPFGDISFADEAVSLEFGKPKAAGINSRPESSLGIPDYKSTKDDTYVSLSCGGTLTLRFTDNALVDVPGPDLYVFEIGPAVEATSLSISADGNEWIEVGKISGARADVDIASFVRPGDVLHYVRLTDLKADCRGRWPGADIDAVGAIGAAVQFSLNGAVLFDTGKPDLKPAAAAELDKLAEQLAAYAKAPVLIEGHTDNVGSDSDNQTLSENRARAVSEYLQKRTELSKFQFSSKGYGESRPKAPNETEEGRARNRRVDVVLLPEKE